MTMCVPEKTLHNVWRRADKRRSMIGAADGEQYRVLYSGMPGGSLGPDFRDAVLEAVDGSELQGDVEIHREASDWYAHGHNGDGRYGRVIFHLVGSASDTHIDTMNSIGMSVPELHFDDLIDNADTPVFEREIHASAHETEMSVNESLDAAGDERFALKIASQRIDVQTFGPDIALQLAIFECLGYPRNRHAFRHLAQRMPWPFLARFARTKKRDNGNDIERAASLLRWAGGFGERPSWVVPPRLLGENPKWSAASTRPANRPETRLTAAAHIVTKWWHVGGPLRHALNVMRQTKNKNVAGLRNAYIVDGGLLGTGRASEIIVNAVLPTLAAWAEIGRDGGLYSEAMHLYRTHTALPSNSVFEEAKRVLVQRGVVLPKVRGARRQQGVMHLYKSMLLRPRTPRQMLLGHQALSS